MLEYDFENSVGYWICQASQIFQRAFNEELAPQGVTFRQAQVLGCLALEGRLSQTDLAERMRIEPPTLVGILDRMERDGWIRRGGDTTDRRRKLIEPLAGRQASLDEDRRGRQARPRPRNPRHDGNATYSTEEAAPHSFRTICDEPSDATSR